VPESLHDTNFSIIEHSATSLNKGQLYFNMTNHNGLTKPPSFLHTLPPELHLEIYTHLLTTPSPLKGRTSRGIERYDIHTSILRTCKQIHDEARHVFFGRNTFCITPLPPSSHYPSPEEESGERSATSEPPLQPKDLLLIRHLSIDILYYPKTLTIGTWSDGRGWLPISTGAQAYITSLSHLLHGVGANLKSLEIRADARPHTTPIPLDEYGYIDSRGCVLDIKKYLTGFYFADQHPAFQNALAALTNVGSFSLQFDFEEIYFSFTVRKEELVGRNLTSLAGQVLSLRQSAMSGLLGGKDGVAEDDQGAEGKMGEEGIVLDWPWRDEERRGGRRGFAMGM
jgi:hypothetical protein